MPLKRLTRITLLAALCVVLRQAFAFLPNVQPISAIFFLLVLFEDWQFACLVMAVTMFTSAFLLGMSPVVLAQILAFGLLLTLWRGALPPSVFASSDSSGRHLILSLRDSD